MNSGLGSKNVKILFMVFLNGFCRFWRHIISYPAPMYNCVLIPEIDLIQFEPRVQPTINLAN